MYFLKNDIIGLRTLQETDVKGNYGKWFNDAEVCHYNSHHCFPCGENELLEYIKNIYNNKNTIVFAIEVIGLSNHIGNISLQNIDFINRSAEIAFIIGEKEYWGKGYAKQAAELLIDHAFAQLGMERIYFGTSEENHAMQRLGEKLAFVKEGVRRKALFKNGHFCDIYEYGLLRQEWKNIT